MNRLTKIIFLFGLIQAFEYQTCPRDGETGGCDNANVDDDYACDNFKEECIIMPRCGKVNKTDLVNFYENCEDYHVQRGYYDSYKCTKNPKNEPDKSCMEKLICSAVSGTKTDEECREFYSKEGYLCLSNPSGTGCEEKEECPTKRTLNENEQCSDFQVSDIKKVCIKGDEEGKCKEEYTCNGAIFDNENDDCSKYIVADKSKLVCLKNSEGTVSACKEVQLYKTVIGKEINKELSDSDCYKYAVSIDNKETHLYIKDPNNNQCIKQILCESVKKGTSDIICSNYPVKLENIDVDICSENPNGETPCIEKEKLSFSGTVTEEITTSNIDISTTILKVIDTIIQKEIETISNHNSFYNR